MSFNAIHDVKILAKISEFTVLCCFFLPQAMGQEENQCGVVSLKMNFIRRSDTTDHTH